MTKLSELRYRMVSMFIIASFFAHARALPDVIKCIAADGKLRGPTRINHNEGVCRDDDSAFWLYGNQCRMMFCQSSPGTTSCGSILLISPRIINHRECPAQEDLPRYTSFEANGDLVIYAQQKGQQEPDDYKVLFRLSETASSGGNFGTKFTNLGDGNPELTLTKDGNVEIRVNTELAWSMFPL
eukprot:CAMPEP_0194275782 /NCGR_PEP_ID=MMETSP0169-20130528/8543_1 /TAXON_ID=218684 /ORGANISM="Corethron pennatum, Strain L29A3" /LENGTH=183 /DNA_ID=CAMNT_0039019337 /DNA_START=88 /DNA_END=639 /DNA_ORIENTATION=-